MKKAWVWSTLLALASNAGSASVGRDQLLGTQKAPSIQSELTVRSRRLHQDDPPRPPPPELPAPPAAPASTLVDRTSGDCPDPCLASLHLTVTGDKFYGATATSEVNCDQLRGSVTGTQPRLGCPKDSDCL